MLLIVSIDISAKAAALTPWEYAENKTRFPGAEMLNQPLWAFMILSLTSPKLDLRLSKPGMANMMFPSGRCVLELGPTLRFYTPPRQPLVSGVHKIKIRQLALADFYWPTL